jgi:hypothetical protein
MSQQHWKKAIENPSGPGALSLTISFTTPKTSSSIKGKSNIIQYPSSIEEKAKPSSKGLLTSLSVKKNCRKNL